MKKQKVFKLIMLLTFLVGIAVISTGCGKNGGISLFKQTVNLNDYVTINPLGYDGAGRVEVIFDYEKLTKDYEDKIKKKPDPKLFGELKGTEAANHAFSYYFPYRFVPEVNEGYKNGDKVQLKWSVSEPGLKALDGVINLKYEYSDVEYTMEGLEEGRVVDIFEKMNVDYLGISGKGTVSEYGAYGTFLDKEGNEVKVELDVDHGYRSEWKNGDTVHVKVSESYPEFYFSDYYGVEFEETEMDYVLTTLSYYPTQGREAIDYLSQKSINNATTAMVEQLDKKYKDLETKRQVSLVGTMFYYQNEGNDIKDKQLTTNLKNKLIFIYKVTDENIPDGWYTYISTKNDVLIYHPELEDGTFAKETRLDTQKVLYKNMANYDNAKTVDDKIFPITFKYQPEGSVRMIEYSGNRSLADLIFGIEKYHTEKVKYDHLAVSSSLVSYAGQY